MARHKLMVLSDARDDRHDAYNDWYDNVHLKDVLAVDGVIAAQRFKLTGGDKWQYLAIYELECEDPQAVIDELLRRAGTEAMPLSDAIDLDHYYMALASPITDLRRPS